MRPDRLSKEDTKTLNGFLQLKRELLQQIKEDPKTAGKWKKVIEKILNERLEETP